MKQGPTWSTQPVYRTRPLPVGTLRGTFLVAEAILPATRTALSSFAQAGAVDGGHEGIAYWAGLEQGDITVLLHVTVPRAEHGPFRVAVSAPEVGRMHRAVRRHRLGILSQVHSHPGDDTRHSDGDDELVLLPFEGMLSLVAPHYGLTLERFDQLSVHQFQGGQWVWCTPDSVSRSVVMVPTFEDLR